MRILALDAAGPRRGVALVEDGTVRRRLISETGGAGAASEGDGLAVMLREAMESQPAPDLLAVTTGPGSFTGLRGAIALAHGFAAASGARVVGVPVALAFAQALPTLRRPLWSAIRARRGRVFLDPDGITRGYDDSDLPSPAGPIALAGDAAAEVAAALAARGFDVMLTDARRIDPVWVARAAAPLPATGAPVLPLYVDPPEAKPPAGGLRPPPA